MNLKFFNSLTKEKKDFKPIDAKRVRLYVCGPTVYDRAHIGNARAMVVFDMLYRILVHAYGEPHVSYVRNITDVDDKINARAKERNISIQELTHQTTQMFHDDMEAIGCIPLHTGSKQRLEPKATEHIEPMISMCQTLIERGFAYESDGHILFDVSSYDQYGHLSRRDLNEMIAGARIDIASYKKDPADFVLWKPSEHDEPGWDSPWGFGRPGWHIECSAMSTMYLGETFDIHGGGADLQFPHHENEIAQSCCTYPDSQFAKTWIHNGFLTVGGEKMSKSLGNFITIDQLLNDNIPGEIIRFLLLGTHYRKPLDWNDKAVHDATKSMNSFYHALEEYSVKNSDTPAPDDFVDALCDDMNIPKAIAVMHRLVKAITQSNDASQTSAYQSQLMACGHLLGILQLSPSQWSAHTEPNQAHDAKAIEALIVARNKARKDKDWTQADQIRDTLTSMNITLTDHPDGTTHWS